MTRFDLTQAARSDLAGIERYGEANWGRARARAYIDALWAQLVLLAARPAIGRSRTEVGPGLRSFPFESHVIFYEMVEPGILVIRILHMRQDAGRHLFE